MLTLHQHCKILQIKRLATTQRLLVNDGTTGKNGVNDQQNLSLMVHDTNKKMQISLQHITLTTLTDINSLDDETDWMILGNTFHWQNCLI